MENIIEIKNLKKKYDDKFELGEIDIKIEVSSGLFHCFKVLLPVFTFK